ncbi:cupin domain-containing protein [Sulfuricurvum sp.]|uniref:cupin domain-containing protein n=1 Tax=Sulfuricurvum sp. TaxID=2025608 RepID=UPI003BB52E4A
MILVNNLYISKEPSANSEIFSTLLHTHSLKIESIRSSLTTPGEFYNQKQDEWVLLLTGEACLQIKDQILNLVAGDYCFIPKHTKHRVISTSNDALWLGVFSS